MDEVEEIVEKLVRIQRYDPDCDYRKFFKNICLSMDKKGREYIHDLVFQSREVITWLKFRFPNGYIDEKLVLKYGLYDPDYIGYKVAVKIINEEEEGNPYSIYVPLPEPKKFPVIPWDKLYDDNYKFNKEETIKNAIKEIKIMRKTGEDIRPIPPHDVYFVTSDKDLVSVHDTIEVDGVMYFWGYILDYLF